MNNARRRSTPLLMFALFALVCSLRTQCQGDRAFENHFLRMNILPGWKVDVVDPQILNLRHGKYLLMIDPVFTHASGIDGGRFYEIISGLSVYAVMKSVEGPQSGFECSQSPGDSIEVNKTISLGNLYTDSSKTGSGCVFPSDGQPVWFGSLFSGKGPEGEYTITLLYDTTDVNLLPRKNTPALRQIFQDVVVMLRSLELKPPIIISKIEPQSAPPGDTVTIYGSWFEAPHNQIAVQFAEYPNNSVAAPNIAADGKSLTFEIPPSLQTISCPAGKIDINESCVPMPANHIEVNDCPRKSDGSTNFCGVPMPPGTYHISLTAEGTGVYSNAVQLKITAPKPTSVSILLIYPNYVVSPGDLITVRGSGFRESGNTVKIGAAVVGNVPSPDGKTLTFQAPLPAGASFYPGLRIYYASVLNAYGESNPIFSYR